MKIIMMLMSTVLSVFAVEPLVSPQWLGQNLNNPAVRIVEVSEGESYELEHIPGAAHTSIGAWRHDNGIFLSIRSVEQIEKEISRLGIDEKSEVVLYAPIGEPKDLLKASYIYWALNYHGIKNVGILDGGMKAWKNDSLPLTSEESVIQASAFKARLDNGKIADLAYVKNHLGKLPMIDARPSDMYLGVTPTPTVKRNGHVEGAMSYSWNYSVGKDYILKPKAMLESVFKEGYRLDKDKEVLVYCTGGLETSYNYFVLSGVLGYKHVRLYDASMKEWGNREDTPMTHYRYEMFSK